MFGESEEVCEVTYKSKGGLNEVKKPLKPFVLHETL